MIHKCLGAAIVSLLVTLGCLASAYAAPIAPTAVTALGPPAEPVSFWGLPFPFGYTYFPGQCYTHVQVATPTGFVWRRVWICTEADRRGYQRHYHDRF